MRRIKLDSIQTFPELIGNSWVWRADCSVLFVGHAWPHRKSCRIESIATEACRTMKVDTDAWFCWSLNCIERIDWSTPSTQRTALESEETAIAVLSLHSIVSAWTTRACHFNSMGEKERTHISSRFAFAAIERGSASFEHTLSGTGLFCSDVTPECHRQKVCHSSQL